MPTPDGSHSPSRRPENSRPEQRWGNGIDVRSVDKADLTWDTEWRINVYEGVTWKRAEDTTQLATSKILPVTHSTSAQSTCRSDSETRTVYEYENVVFMFEKGRGIQVVLKWFRQNVCRYHFEGPEELYKAVSSNF
jgi:hypothetical protein